MAAPTTWTSSSIVESASGANQSPGLTPVVPAGSATAPKFAIVWLQSTTVVDCATAGWTKLIEHVDVNRIEVWGNNTTNDSPNFTTSSSLAFTAVATRPDDGDFDATLANIYLAGVGASQNTGGATVTYSAVDPGAGNNKVIFLIAYGRQGTFTSATAPAEFTLLYDEQTTALDMQVAAVKVQDGSDAALVSGTWPDPAGFSDGTRVMTVSLALEFVDVAPPEGVLSLEPLYYGATPLANKTNVEYLVTPGWQSIHGTAEVEGVAYETLDFGIDGTTDANGVFVRPASDASLGAPNDQVTLHLYWEEGTDPIVDRSLIVKTTLVEDV